MNSIEVNRTFSSYKDLQNAVDLYEKENCVQFWKRDAKTINSAKFHSPNVFLKARQELHYYKLKYACIHGGQAFRPKNKKKLRNHQGTWKQDCKVHITVGLTSDGAALIIKSMNNAHNHELPSRDMFNQLPKQRRLNDENRQQVENLMKLKVNKKLLQADLLQKTGNSILLKDLSNIYTASRVSKSNFEDVVKKLTEIYKCTVDYVTNDQTFSGIFFQDAFMKMSFDLFPEVIFMDGTYKLLNIRCPVYILATENSFGTTDIVGIGIIVSENTDSLNWMIEKFKERNTKWPQISVVMTDKCISERQVITKQFPTASKLICMFHVLQIFRREITVHKLNITAEDMTKSLHYLQKLAYATSEEDYTGILNEMENSVPNVVLEYYFKNWHSIRNEWVKGLVAKSGNFFNFTNNRLESLNSKLKSVISTYSTFDEFIDKVFILLKIKRTQFQNELRNMILKVPFTTDISVAETNYKNELTPFAYKKIDIFFKNLQLLVDQQVYKKIDNSLYCTELGCECPFFTSMKLPCKHVLAYRKHTGLNLFDKVLFSKRWSRSYITSNYNINNNETVVADIIENVTCTKISSTPIMGKLTSHQKFKKAQAVCLNLATLCSEVSTEEFNRRLNSLISLQNNWQNHRQVSLVVNDYEEHQDHLLTTDSSMEDPQNEISNQDPRDLANDHLSSIIQEHDYCSGPEKIINKNNHSVTFSTHQDLESINKLIKSVEVENVENVTTEFIEANDAELTLKDVSMPEPIKSRGRPKGRSLTAIGLPKRKRVQDKQQMERTKRRK